MAYGFAVFLSDLHFHFSKTDRRAVENNLKIIMNTDSVSPRDTRAVFRNFGKYLVDFFTMTKYLTPEFVRAHIDIKNMDVLNDVLQEGKGGIVVSAHLGNWEMGGAILPTMGYPVSIIALPHKEEKVNNFFNRQREAFGSVVIQTTVAVRRVMEHLKMNRFIAILADRDFGHNGLVMDFFGKKTMIPRGASVFSLKTGAPIILVFFIRKDDDHFEIKLYPPIYPPSIPDGKITDDILKTYTQQYLTIFEEEIRKNPTQWLMFREFGVNENIDNYTRS